MAQITLEGISKRFTVYERERTQESIRPEAAGGGSAEIGGFFH